MLLKPHTAQGCTYLATLFRLRLLIFTVYLECVIVAVVTALTPAQQTRLFSLEMCGRCFVSPDASFSSSDDLYTFHGDHSAAEKQALFAVEAFNCLWALFFAGPPRPSTPSNPSLASWQIRANGSRQRLRES